MEGERKEGGRGGVREERRKENQEREVTKEMWD